MAPGRLPRASLPRDPAPAAEATRLHELLERLGAALRAEARAAGADLGLQPVHAEVLGYLGRCNRYSDGPLALAEYLGLTKGTVSQSIALLERRGLVARGDDPADGRKVHLRLTPAGKRALARLVPAGGLEAGADALGHAERAALLTALEGLLRALQRARGGRSFGVCGTCRHFLREPDGGRRCGLTREPLTERDATLLCREHEGLAPAAAGGP